MSKVTDQEIKNKKLEYWIIFSLVIVNMIVFIFLFNSLYFRLDMTEGQKYSISKPTIDLIRSLDRNETLLIQYYYNDKIKENSQIAQIIQYVDDILKEYENTSHGVINYKVKQLNFTKDKAELAELEQAGMQPFALSEQKEGESKESLGYSGLIIKYKGKQDVLSPVVEDTGFEYNLDVTIKKLTKGESNTLGVIVASSDKSLDKDYKYLNSFVQNEYKDVKVINSGEDIPAQVSTLLVVGGETITDYDAFKIDQFLMRGGKMFLALGGVKVIINPQYGIFGMPADSKLFDLLNFYGIKVNKNMIGDNESYNAFPQRENAGGFVQVRQMRYPIWPKITSKNVNHTNPISEGLSGLPLFWPSSIDIDEKIKSNASMLFKTTKNSWAETSSFKLDFETYKFPIQKAEKSYDMAYAFEGKLGSFYENKEVPKKTGKDGKEEKYTGDKLSSGKTKIVVVGDEWLFWDNVMTKETQLFLLNSLDWLSMDNSLIKIRNKGKFSRPLDKQIKQDFDTYKNLIIIITTYIIPVLFVIIAIVLNFLKNLRNEKIRQLYQKKNE